MIAAMSMAMVVPAFAGQIYVGDTETVVSYDENGNKVITMIFDPAKTPDFFKEQYITPPQPTKTAGEERIRAEPLREAPEVGAVPAQIHRINENGEMVIWSLPLRTSAAAAGNAHGTPEGGSRKYTA